MKDPQIAKAASARSKAQAALERKEQSDAEFFRERRRQEEANRLKTARLKALRLAKEATEREAATAAALEPAAKRTRRANKKAPATPSAELDPSQ